MPKTMNKVIAIRVDEEVYDVIREHVYVIEAELDRRATMNDGLRRALGMGWEKPTTRQDGAGGSR